jgi:selenocysteine lyase/cysteine desulfurase
VSPKEEAFRTAIISFRMTSRTFAQVNEHLTKDRIRVRTVTEGGVNGIRVSFHICNQDDEVTRIVESLKRLAS